MAKIYINITWSVINTFFSFLILILHFMNKLKIDSIHGFNLLNINLSIFCIFVEKLILQSIPFFLEYS